MDQKLEKLPKLTWVTPDFQVFTNLEQLVQGCSAGQTKDCRITADGPVTVAQYSAGNLCRGPRASENLPECSYDPEDPGDGNTVPF